MRTTTGVLLTRMARAGHVIGSRIAHRYPLMPFRGRISRLRGSATDIPTGLVVETREGIRIKVSPDGMYRDVYLWGDYEPYHTKIYRRIIRPGDTVFDVGANFGWFTALFARWVGGTGRVHAFEPVPFIHALAAENLALNGLGPPVELNRVALGQESGLLTIHTYAGLPHGHATVADLARDDVVDHVCTVRSLDEYCAENLVESIRFMKVDVEGFEPDVFLGGPDILSERNAPVIAFEVNRECLDARALRSADVIGILRSFGYTDFYWFSTRTGVRPIESDDSAEGDCLAAKKSHLGDLRRALRTGRLFR